MAVLMPVSKTSDLVERLANDGGAAMNGPHTFHVGQRRLAVDGVSKNIEHSRQNVFADRHLQRPAGVLHRHAA